MRIPVILVFLAMLVPGLAQAGGWTAQAATIASAGASAKKEEPAKAAPTIIPGSPLAALAGAATQAPSGSTSELRAPFGTQAIGFTLSAVLGRSTIQTFDDFTDTLNRSLRLTPVVRWAHDITKSPRRQADAMAILRGFALVIVPGLLLDALMLLLLRRVSAFCAKRSMPRADEFLLNTNSGSEDSFPQIPLRLSLKGWGRRLWYALLKFGLMLVPLAVFVTFVLLALSTDLIANRAAHLAITGITNAYICARLAYDFLRLLLAPNTPSLRLIRIPSSYARWTMRRWAILLATFVVGFCLISGMEILDLSEVGASSLTHFVALLAHLELALWIWQSRRVVSRWIAGKSDSDSLWAGMRQRLAKVWYVFALFYLIGLWLAWAGGVHNALGWILRSVLVGVGVLVLARLAWIGCNRLIRRIMPDEDDETAHEMSIFFRRLRAYAFPVRILARCIIALLAVVVILQGVGVNAFAWVLSNPIGLALLSTLSNIVVTIVLAVLVWEFFNYLLDRRIESLHKAGRIRQAVRLRTLSPMLRAALSIAVVMLALIIGLSRIGVNTTGLLAVSSVVGIAVGFGSQKLVQDVITGLFLLFEDAVQVGDSVTLGGVSGTVERLSIRTIRLRGSDGAVNIIPFSSVTIVSNQTRDFSLAQLSIMIGYRENVERAINLLKEIGAEMRAEPGWSAMIRDDIQIFGLDVFGELGLVITGQIRTGPGQHASVRREFQARVQKCFMEEGIELPYRHQTLQLEVPEDGLGVINDKHPPS